MGRAFGDPVGRALELRAPIVSVKAKWLSSSLVNRAHRSDLQVFGWTVNDEAEIRRVLDLGVDGVISDYPDRVAQVMGSRCGSTPPT